MVYMTAFAAPAGTSLLDALGNEYLWWMTPDSAVCNSLFTGMYLRDGMLIFVQDEFVTAAHGSQVFYADVADQTVVTKAVAELKAEPARIFTDDTSYEPWNNGVEVGFFFTEQEQAIPLAVQQSMASQFPSGYVSYTMNSSHSPFLSMPDEVVTGVVLAATEGLAKKLL